MFYTMRILWEGVVILEDYYPKEEKDRAREDFVCLGLTLRQDETVQLSETVSGTVLEEYTNA